VDDRHRVLIVDDEPDIVETLDFALRRRGFEVEAAYDGPQGLEAARHQPPDVMLLDVMLPGCNGYEVSRQLKDWMASSPDAKPFPILLVTARKVNTREREDFVAMWSRADGVIYKPFDLEHLVQRIHELLTSAPASV
jgi:two-component system OmpR family response regulator